MLDSLRSPSRPSFSAVERRVARQVAADVKRLGRHWRTCVRSGARQKVHSVRVAARRLDALLDLVGGVLPKPVVAAARAALREVLRAVGGLRDATVQRREVSRLLLGEFSDEVKIPRTLVKASGALVSKKDRNRLQRVFRRREQRRRVESARALRSADPRDVLAEVASRLKEPGRAGRLGTRWNVIVRAVVERAAAQVVARWPRDFDDPMEYHRARIAVKQYRYAMESAGRLGLAVPRGVARLQAVQDRLGLLHDCELLQARLTKLVARKKIAPAVRHALGPVLAWRIDQLRPARSSRPPLPSRAVRRRT